MMKLEFQSTDFEGENEMKKLSFKYKILKKQKNKQTPAFRIYTELNALLQRNN